VPLVCFGEVFGDRFGVVCWDCLSVGHGQGDVLDVGQAGLFTDGSGELAADFAAIVLRRVMAGGDLDAAAGVQVVDGEINLGGIDHTDVNDGCVGGDNTIDQGLGQSRAVGSHVSADDD